MQPLVILGAHATGTSTAVGICNLDPASHVLYEVDFAAAQNRHNDYLVAQIPAIHDLFNAQDAALGWRLKEIIARHAPWRELYTNVFGTKIVGLRPETLKANQDVSAIFVVRDLRTWIVKHQFGKKDYRVSGKHFENIAPVAVEYAQYLLRSFTHPRVLHIRMEDLFLADSNALPRAIAGFLGVAPAPLENYWDKRDVVAAKFAYDNWMDVHPSALAKPVPDTKVELKELAFWNAFLPIFDKYYGRVHQKFTAEEIAADERELTSIAERLPMSISTGFESIQTEKFGFYKRVSISDDGVQYV